MEARKNPEVDIEKQRPLYLAIGFIVAFSFLLMAFEWKSFQEIVIQTLNIEFVDEIEEIPTVIIQQNTPPPPPPPPDVVEMIEIVENDKEVLNELKVDNVEAPEEVVIIKEPSAGKEVVTDNQVFMIVEEMPRFSGCESVKGEDKATECFNREIAKFLGKNIQYPQRAKEANVEGIVYVQFTVDQNGNVKDVKIIRGIGFGCDEEAARVVNKLPKFSPGKQRGRPVQVQYTLPINFKLK
jgi:protein TonB